MMNFFYSLERKEQERKDKDRKDRDDASDGKIFFFIQIQIQIFIIFNSNRT